MNGDNAVRKKLRLNRNEEAEYPCPVEQCIHRTFKSKRGCRKHVDTRHGWYHYFPTACERNAATDADKKRPSTSAQPAFSVDEGFGNQLLRWLCTPCGGSKNVKDARQSATRAMIFLLFSSGNAYFYRLLRRFSVKEIESKWKLKSSGSYNYRSPITSGKQMVCPIIH